VATEEATYPGFRHLNTPAAGHHLPDLQLRQRHFVRRNFTSVRHSREHSGRRGYREGVGSITTGKTDNVGDVGASRGEGARKSGAWLQWEKCGRRWIRGWKWWAGFKWPRIRRCQPAQESTFFGRPLNSNDLGIHRCFCFVIAPDRGPPRWPTSTSAERALPDRLSVFLRANSALLPPSRITEPPSPPLPPFLRQQVPPP